MSYKRFFRHTDLINLKEICMKTGKGFIFKILPALVLAVLMQSVFVSAALAANPAILVECPTGTDIITSGDPIDFGNVAVGQSVTKTITIKNVSTAGDLILNGGTSPYVSLGSDTSIPCSITQPISPVTFGSSTSFTVTYAPTIVISLLDSLIINSDDNNGNNALTFILMGEGIAPTAPRPLRLR